MWDYFCAVCGAPISLWDMYLCRECRRKQAALEGRG